MVDFFFFFFLHFFKKKQTENCQQCTDTALMSLGVFQSVEDVIFPNLYSHIIS